MGDGRAFTVTVVVIAHPVKGLVKVIIAMPAETPLIYPEEGRSSLTTVAMLVLLLEYAPYKSKSSPYQK